MLRNGKIVHESNDGSLHESYWAAWWRSVRYGFFMTTYGGRPHTAGYSWDATTGKRVDHHKSERYEKPPLSDPASLPKPIRRHIDRGQGE